LKLVALINSKARDAVKGRKNLKNDLAKIDFTKDKWIWFHCASLGEFEQGRSLIEEIKKKHSRYKILLSFFSPSGYSIRKNYEFADSVVYMPFDTKTNAVYFIKTIKPVLAVFVKYEFWFHHLHQLKKYNVKTILISAAFRKQQPFFKWYGRIFRKMLFCFNAVFIQDETSRSLLNKIGMGKNIFIAGDTRYDRVNEIAIQAKKNPEVEKFLSGSKSLIAGSTWFDDEKIIKESLIALPKEWKIIIAPHEVSPNRLKNVTKLFGDEAIFFSELKENMSHIGKRILVIDNIGMLSNLYACGTIAFIGGGFQKGGIHNILEPAVFGLPVIFGPVYKKFVEANELKQLSFAFSISDAAECRKVLSNLVKNEQEYLNLSHSLRQYMSTKTGATSAIIKYLEQNDWV
jgi:3-deoxy-D-manno-octulosonic-acid transferase